MDFTEIALIGLDGEAAETVSELFNRYGYGGAVIEALAPDFDKVTVRTVIPRDDLYRLREIEVMLALVSQALPHGLPEARLHPVGESDWVESWKQHFHVIRLGRRFVIKPSWREYTPAPADLVLEIDPGLAFGSGLHPTTQLCLQIFEEMPLAGQSLFDIGTGSGILALAALKLGAHPVRAVDIDEIAVRVARENFERNGYILLDSGLDRQTAGDGVEALAGSLPKGSTPDIPNVIGSITGQVEVAVGSATATGGRKWQVVVANILASVLVELMPDLAAALAPGGSLILSGIIAEQEAEVTAAAAEHHLQIIDKRTDEDWLALVAKALSSV
jgi:ribosomal protein L11 methyltransferase